MLGGAAQTFHAGGRHGPLLHWRLSDVRLVLPVVVAEVEVGVQRLDNLHRVAVSRLTAGE